MISRDVAKSLSPFRLIFTTPMRNTPSFWITGGGGISGMRIFGIPIVFASGGENWKGLASEVFACVELLSHYSGPLAKTLMDGLLIVNLSNFNPTSLVYKSISIAAWLEN